MHDTISGHIAAIEDFATVVETPCGDGTMAWRIWGDGEPLVLLHGGSGSWKHWFRTIPHFMHSRRLIVADMPGYGDSAMPPLPTGFDALGRIMARGLDEIVGSGNFYDIAGFSLGSFMAPHVIRNSAAKARTLVLAHGHLVGRMEFSPQQTLKRWRTVEDPGERREVLRHNLGALMLAHPESADDLTIEIYRMDLEKSRLRVPEFINTLDTRILAELELNLVSISGEIDPTASPNVPVQMERLRELRPDALTHMIPAAGHWVMHESPSAFNQLLDKSLQA